MREFAIVYEWGQYAYPLTVYVTEEQLEPMIEAIERHPCQTLVEYYEI